MKKQNKSYLILIILLVSITNIMAGIGDYEKHKIYASDGANYNYFGYRNSVAIDGNYAIVGAHFADVNGINNCGAAYIYFWNGTNWVEQAKLSASNAAEDQRFGQSVSISGDKVVIGAIGTYSTNSLGQGYVFKRNGTSWYEEAILTASDGANRDAFGTDVSILGDELFVSANDINNYKGAVYYFKYNGTNWIEEQIITPTSSSGWKQFGKSLVFDESNLLVGCIDDSYPGFGMPGSVYAFTRENGTWVQKSRILPDDITVRESFGFSVTLKNDVAIISDVDTTPEKVYIFNKTNDTTWTQIDTLKSGATTNDLFGYEVAIDDEHILVGSMENSEAAYEAGCVFVYTKNSGAWNLDEKILPPDSEFMGQFGISVACNNGRYIIGASSTSGNTNTSGAAFIYMGPQITSGVILSENFNDTQFPPNGWTQTILNSANTWGNSNPADNPFTIDPENVYSAICPWVAANQDEWLKAPIVSLQNDAISLEFYAGYSTNWLTSATLKLNISIDSGSNWTKIWEAENDGNGWTWRKISLDLTSYGNNSNVMLAWQYVGNDGDLVGIDNVMLTYGTVDVNETEITQIPTEFKLNQNFPNPFNPSTIISYQIPKQEFVTLNIYNMLGEKVASLVNEEQSAGNYQFKFDARNLSSGAYIYQIQYGNFVQARKMLLIK